MSAAAEKIRDHCARGLKVIDEENQARIRAGKGKWEIIGERLVSAYQLTALYEIAAQLAELNANLIAFKEAAEKLQLDFLRGDVR